MSGETVCDPCARMNDNDIPQDVLNKNSYANSDHARELGMGNEQYWDSCSLPFYSYFTNSEFQLSGCEE